MKWVGRPDIDRVKVGDEVNLPVTFLNDMPSFAGYVVYIHPKKRFFTVEFEKSHIRQSYCAYGPLP